MPLADKARKLGQLIPRYHQNPTVGLLKEIQPFLPEGVKISGLARGGFLVVVRHRESVFNLGGATPIPKVLNFNASVVVEVFPQADYAVIRKDKLGLTDDEQNDLFRFAKALFEVPPKPAPTRWERLLADDDF